MQAELSKALAAVGESAPERPQPIDRPWSDELAAQEIRALERHVLSIESLALRLAVRLAAKSCPVCAARSRRLCGKGSASFDESVYCYLVEGHEGSCEFAVWRYTTGTGKEQPR